MNKIVLLVLGIVFLLSARVFSQNISNEGTDFWAVFPTHVPSGTNAEIAIFVTSKTSSEATVSCGTYTDTKLIPANTAVQFNVPRANAYIAFGEANSSTPLVNRGIRIKVPNGKPKVSAYAHIYGNARSAASLILPYETLGQTYYSMNYTQVDFGSSYGNNFLVLVAADDNMDLIIHESNGNPKSIHFNKAGDVYEYMAGQTDFTGISVNTDPATSSCKKFAAFSGNSMIRLENCGSPGSSSSFDPLYQQLYPTVSWGKNYGVVPFKDRTYILRIIAQEDNTTVKFNGESFVVNKGQYIESATLSAPTFVTADKLICVAQFAMSQKCTSAIGSALVGDPDMVILNPIEFNIKSVTVFSSTLQNITERYINVLMATNKTSTFKVDGVAPTSPWVVMTSNPLYSYNQIPVQGTSGGSTFKSLTLTADDGFNATAYGFGNAESYAYSAGTNLASNNYLTLIKEASQEESVNGCVNETTSFKVSLPYEPDHVTWVLDGGTPIESGPSPAHEVKTVNGQITYVYTYPNTLNFPTAGLHNLTITAHLLPNASTCQSGDYTITYPFNVYDPPKANFEPVAATCENSEIAFIDKSISNVPDFSVTEWLWNFGDGTTASTEQNPKHTYAHEGKYTVSLTVKSGTSCSSEVFSQEITINPLPVSHFESLPKACINTAYLITDGSTISNAKAPNKIVKWHWDFGDGSTPIDKTDGMPFTYVFTTLGEKNITLTTTSENGCINVSAPKLVTVFALPQASFNLPDVCSSDGMATFINTSTDATDGDGNFTYKWDFGDPTNTASSNTSAEKDGKHQYINPGSYTVTLTVTNSNGCESKKVDNSFVVNGRIDEAKITVHNPDNLCSNTDVVITNGFTALIGKVVKIEIYKDYKSGEANEITKTILYPNNTDDINLSYDSFGGVEPKKYIIRVVGYTGDNDVCIKEFSQEITLKPAPQLSFSDIGSLCDNQAMVVITEASETSGYPGQGVFTSDGDGMSADGNYNPKIAGTGTHNITFTYTGDNGCVSSVTKSVQIFKSPTADAGSTLYVLAGGEIKIPAIAEGSDLTYKWTPSAGLSNDAVLNPIASPEKDTEYQLEVRSNEGCTAISTVLVKVLEALSPPNTFSPNGDNVNDVWVIKYLDSYPNATVEIFNRNGNRVFFSNGYKIPFDGNYQNEPLPVGVYYYVINPKNGRKTISGPLTIIR
ncbi:PKD domain-containing protein [Pedobacter nototheniae]|uniref:PKD domain-containing protein n=1 Tax=Pedobacter nototheniae TaxID=2488994 RepID=UPI00292DDBC5|nr:PKD domain-containing protein [Pedobacter nototheniae]